MPGSEEISPNANNIESTQRLTLEQRRSARKALKPFRIAVYASVLDQEMNEAQRSLQSDDSPENQRKFQDSKHAMQKVMKNFVRSIVRPGDGRSKSEVQSLRDQVLEELNLEHLQNLQVDEEWNPQSSTLERIFQQGLEQLTTKGIDLNFMAQFLGAYSPRIILEKAKAGELSITSDQLALLKGITKPGWIQKRLQALGPLQRLVIEGAGLFVVQALEDARALAVNPQSQVTRIPQENIDPRSVHPFFPDLSTSPLSNLGDVYDGFYFSLLGRTAASILFPSLSERVRTLAGACVGMAAIVTWELGLVPAIHSQLPDWKDIAGGSLGPISYVLLHTLFRGFYARSISIDNRPEESNVPLSVLQPQSSSENKD